MMAASYLVLTRLSRASWRRGLTKKDASVPDLVDHIGDDRFSSWQILTLQLTTSPAQCVLWRQKNVEQ